MKDRQIEKLIKKETNRQADTLNLIASENYVSKDVLKVLGSTLVNKYAEGYPSQRYYGGNKFVDKIEQLAQARALKLFNLSIKEWSVNVQPYSGSPANTAVQFAILDAGDRVLGFKLTAGGHLTHGHPKVTFSGKYFEVMQYGVREADGQIDYDEVAEMAKKFKPKLIICGLTAYPYKLDFKRFGAIADSVGAYLMADIAHIAGLVVAGVHQSPVPYAHVVTTTTHKTMRGPRGAMILVTKKGLAKDPDLASKVDKAIFPGLQGGPHDHTTAGIAVALKEANTASFKTYGATVAKNAQVLAQTLTSKGITLVSGGTQNHLMVVDARKQLGVGGGIFLEYALDQIGVTLNKNTVPHDPAPPFYPSGVRLGTPAVTTRGLRAPEMKKIGTWIAQTVEAISKYRLPEDKESRAVYVKKAKEEIKRNSTLKKIRKEVITLCKKFPLPY